jgi:ankyrin repeat protein
MDPNAKNKDGDTALHFAVQEGRLKAVQTLISLGADPNAENNEGETPLMVAGKGNQVASRELRALLKQSASKSPAGPAIARPNRNPVSTPATDTKSSDGAGTPDDRAALTVHNLRDSQIIRSGSRTPDHIVEARRKTEALSSKEKLLLSSVKNGNKEMARKLVKEGISVETANQEGTTALMLACLDGDWDMFDFLVNELGANTDAVDEHGMTVLMHAAQEGHARIAKDIINKYGARVDVRTEDGDNALMYAAQGGHLSVVKELVEKQEANMDIVDGEGKTALMLAAEAGHQAVVECLLKNHAKVDPAWLVRLASKR